MRRALCACVRQVCLTAAWTGLGPDEMGLFAAPCEQGRRGRGKHEAGESVCGDDVRAPQRVRDEAELAEELPGPRRRSCTLVPSSFSLQTSACPERINKSSVAASPCSTTKHPGVNQRTVESSLMKPIVSASSAIKSRE